MNEFEQKNYQGARDCASAVKTNADNIMTIFESVDNHMKTLYGDSWQSSGADVTNGRYQELRKSYEIFYNKVITMQQYINSATAQYEAADASVSQNISSI